MQADRDARTRPIAPPPAPADLGIVAALPIEVGPLVAGFHDTRKYTSERHSVVEAEYSGKLVALILSGPGRVRARRATELLLAGHRPRWIVSAGFGGALDPDLRRNDLFIANEVHDLDGLRLGIDVQVGHDGEESRFRTGRLLTVDRIVRTAAEKAELRVKTDASVVDMETSAIARVCAERKVRFLSIRVISDEANVDLPREVASILGSSGGYRIGAAIGAIWRRPDCLKDLLALRSQALESASYLARAMPQLLERLD